MTPVSDHAALPATGSSTAEAQQLPGTSSAAQHLAEPLVQRSPAAVLPLPAQQNQTLSAACQDSERTATMAQSTDQTQLISGPISAVVVASVTGISGSGQDLPAAEGLQGPAVLAVHGEGVAHARLPASAPPGVQPSVLQVRCCCCWSSYMLFCLRADRL